MSCDICFFHFSHKGDESGDVTFVVSRTTGQDTLESLTMVSVCHCIRYTICCDIACVVVAQHVVKDALLCIKQLLSALADQSLDK